MKKQAKQPKQQDTPAAKTRESKQRAKDLSAPEEKAGQVKAGAKHFH